MPADATALFERCSWPDLAEPHGTALRDAIRFLLDRFEVDGIVAAGSILRGAGDASSDLDIIVIQRALVRQRIQRRFCGVPAELFVNPPAAIRRYFVQESAAARPLTAHMLATGHVVLALDPVVDALRDEARGWLARRTDLDATDLVRERYMLATALEDALDLRDLEPELASAQAVQAVLGMLAFHCRRATGFVPRHKDLIQVVASIDPELAGSARRLFGAARCSERLELATEIADAVVGEHGFFEWESPPEEVAPETADERAARGGS